MSPSKISTLEFEKFYNIVDGQQRGSDDIHHGINPATGKELWDIPIGTEKDLNDAVAAGKKAFPSWRDTPIQKRKEILLKFADAFSQHAEEFTTLLCKESGKPVCDSRNPRYVIRTHCVIEKVRCCRSRRRRWVHSIPLLVIRDTSLLPHLTIN
jgi:acyl-CoA reductase-like NAD-dependent aldehyde dehydrogenase